MTTLQVAGFSSSILIGISLGLLGGGGSILTLPVLVYLLHINPILSTAYSLFIVGTTSLVGSINYMKQGLINYSAAVAFALPSLVTVILARQFMLPHIPARLPLWAGFELTKPVALMVLFALIMLAAAYSMIRENKAVSVTEREDKGTNFPVIALEGGLVGLVTGIVGAGGGFLIIPTLVLFARLPMKTAIGSSLLIIAFNSLVGFTSSPAAQVIDWGFLSVFTALSVGGIFLGSQLARYIAGQHLRKAFGWFVLGMGVFILAKELLFR
ncbi:hypothetical protein CLV58_11570 [Spirosoma oryzae]|uniref:Probable membrane transporter protein n=1 Tax=Spirosoma oryzae TaxID=1469603 RepID=A0A2T0SNI6_9BACT|nr:sulfite exporter TauE/SafE family protein [Spirosoma oryzae]PRY34987.1 hypothetical protein CLV58_11570 [Spirosoma oryzae]